MKRWVGLALATWVTALSGASLAADYPTRPVRMLVPYTAGGATDTLARAVADKLGQILGQRVIIENKPGGSGTLAAQTLQEAEKDGHTLLFSDSSIFVIVPHTKGLGAWDFTPVALVARQVPVLAVRKSLDIANVAALVRAGKEKPDSLSYGTFGTGTWSHVAMEGLQQQTGAKLVHVPYRGTAQAITDALGERIDVLLNTAGAVSPYLPTGQLKLLAVGTKSRMPAYPDVPTLAESVPGFSIDVWFGLVAAAGTPPDIVEKLEAALRKTGVDEGFRKTLQQQSLEPAMETGAEFGKLMTSEFDRWGKIVKQAGIRE